MKKIKSRKFLVWITSVFLLTVSMYITKTITPEMINMFTVISAIYIGGNTASKFIKNE